MGKYATFGERLKELRLESGFKSQKDFADKIEMAYQTINYYESGKRKPDIEYFKKFADFFGVSYDYLLGESNCKNRENIDISKELGLSEKAITNIKNLNKYCQYDETYGLKSPEEISILNELLSDESFISYSPDNPGNTSMLSHIAQFCIDSEIKDLVFDNLGSLNINEMLKNNIITEFNVNNLSRLETITAIIQNYFHRFIRTYSEGLNSKELINKSMLTYFFAKKYGDIASALFELTDYLKEDGKETDNGQI